MLYQAKSVLGSPYVKIVLLTTLNLIHLACGQEPEQSIYLDQPIDTVALRQEAFQGIGPIPYNLPPKKTQEQLLEDRYALMREDAEALHQYFDGLKLYRQLEESGDSPLVPESSLFGQQGPIDAENNIERSLLASIGFYQRLNNRTAMSDLQNRLAIYYVREAEYNKAIPLFRAALAEKEVLQDHDAKNTVMRNLAIVYQYIAAYPDARHFFEQLAQSAEKVRDFNLQADALSHIAQIKAKNLQFLEAENDVIKKILPLYKKTKNEKGKMEAFNTLASFYRDEKKYTQSRWFYLQAIEIATARNHHNGLANNLYELASVKNGIAEYALAVIDYKAAADFARQSKDRELQLRINNGLSKAYKALGDYGNVATCIKEYYSLKDELLMDVKGSLLTMHLQKNTLLGR